MAEAKNEMKISKDENALVLKALNALKSSILRAKTKEAADEEMGDIYQARIVKVDQLIARIANKELF